MDQNGSQGGIVVVVFRVLHALEQFLGPLLSVLAIQPLHVCRRPQVSREHGSGELESLLSHWKYVFC